MRRTLVSNCIRVTTSTVVNNKSHSPRDSSNSLVALTPTLWEGSSYSLFCAMERHTIPRNLPNTIPTLGAFRPTRNLRIAKAVPWESSLPGPEEPLWGDVGESIVKMALEYDTGPEAFIEVLAAREQLEIIVQSSGYDLSVYPFGGVTVMQLLEVGGDVDFTAVADVEPEYEEASEIISRLSRDMRRLGLRCSSIPRARVPVIKVDRTSTSLPGSPLHMTSSSGMFRFSRSLTVEEQQTFMEILTNEYHAMRCEWDSLDQCAKVQFVDATSLVVGLTHLTKLGSVDIPIRVPVDPRQGPQLYRFPFDFCLSTTGLRNSYLLGKYLQMYPYARHLALLLKRWGRSSGVVSPIDGLLASYAVTVLLVHFLVKIEVLNVDETFRMAAEPQVLPKEIKYSPLATEKGGDMAQLGYIFAQFFEYYSGADNSGVFDYSNDVACTTFAQLSKNQIPGWAETYHQQITGAESGIDRPPFYHFCIKDPFSIDNIARNLGKEACIYVQQANKLVVDYIKRDITDPRFMVNSIVVHGPRPVFSPVNGTYNPKYIDPSNQETTEAFRKLKKMEFHKRQDNLQRFGQNTMRTHSQAKVAQTVTRNMMSWLKDDTFGSSSSNSSSSKDNVEGVLRDEVMVGSKLPHH
eukprot:Tbor_TRINITY_DN4684_c0_g1::TRINITY_DN4684_c0_g1_i1::g.15049::m.15049